MPEGTEVNAAPAEPSISDLRALLKADTEAAAPPAAPATGDEPVKTDPATESDKAAQGKERGSDGKFKSASGDTAEAGEPGDETLPVNVQKRIAKAVKAQREAERKAQELETRLNGNQVSRPAKETAPEPPKAEAPKAESFDTYEEYTRAVSRYEARQEIDAELKRQQEAGEKSARETQQNERHRAFDEAEVEARKTHADYDDVTSSIEWPQTASMGPIADYLLDTKNAGLMYQLGKQPTELARIAALSPVLAIAELGKFEAKLTAAAAPASPATRKPLPKPAAHVGGAASATQVDINDPDIDMKTFKRLFNASYKAS